MTAAGKPLPGPFSGSFVGVDVGENFLDLASVDAPPRTLVFKRVALDGLKGTACGTLAQRIKDAAPELDPRATALVDSPRWPRDLDWSRGTHRRDPAPRGREIDAVLRQIFRTLVAVPAGKAVPAARVRMPGLSMFPTPRYDYFAQWAHDSKCKPHLSAIARELFGALLDADGDARGPAPGGGTFTRFMLAGFAVYRALEQLGVPAFESYPDLQLRLSSPSTALPPKKQRAKALAARRDIVASLAAELGLRDAPVPANLDQADAAALALATAVCARRGALWVISNPCEGRFMLALDAHQACHLSLGNA
ncbi:MAG: hypothetical protein WAN81_15030 [Candidatus Binataceae bacterium]